jgi:hypothetical protein
VDNQKKADGISFCSPPSFLALRECLWTLSSDSFAFIPLPLPKAEPELKLAEEWGQGNV